VLTPRLAWDAAASCLALSGAGCERRTEEARPEPISLSRPAAQRQGIEHGQDPRRADDGHRATGPIGDEAVAGSADGGRSDDERDREVDDGAHDAEGSRDRARRPAKRRRTGGVASRGGDATVSSSLRAKRLVVARDVEDREPVGAARSFDASRVSEVTVFVELVNEERDATRVAVRFEPPTAAAFEVPLEVGASPRWRTWAKTRRPLEEGTWSVRVLDDEGGTVARTTFEVVE
jgi:hypothetical protein